MDFSQFKDYLESLDRAPLTVKGYLRDIHHFEKWFEHTNGEDLSPENITIIDGREYRQFMQMVEKASASTINRKLAALHAFGEWIENAGILDTNPIAAIKGVREQDGGIRWLDKKQQAALMRAVEKSINACKTDGAKQLAIRNRAIVILILNTGLRVNELCNLHLSDIEIMSRKGNLVVRGGKGRKNRTIPLNKSAIDVIKDWYKHRGKLESTFVFYGRSEKGITPNGVQRFMTKYYVPGGIDVTPHLLRHTFCKNLVNLGVSLEKIAALAGHESIETTRRYVEPGKIDLELAVELLED